MCNGVEFSRKRLFIVIGLVVVFVLVVGLAILLVILLRQPAKQEDENPDGKLRLISRREWVAQPPVNHIATLSTPVPYVIICHTATDNCTTLGQCILQVRYIQLFHIESRNWSDIGYNFLVGGDGSAYIGRGWTEVGAHTKSYNRLSIGIAFIGTFINILPPERQLTACKLLIDQGVRLGYVQQDYKLLGARQLTETESPGQMLYEEIQKWPHWASKP